MRTVTRSLRPVPWPEGLEPSGPVSLADVKSYSRITHDAEDDVLSRVLAGATAYAEIATRRTIRLSRWDLVLDGFPPRAIELRMPPVLDVLEVAYRTADGWVLIDPESLDVDIQGDVALVQPLPGQGWPSASSSGRAVRVRYRAGYRPFDYVAEEGLTTPPVIPPGIMAAICAHVEWQMENRGGVAVSVPSSIEALYWSERADL